MSTTAVATDSVGELPQPTEPRFRQEVQVLPPDPNDAPALAMARRGVRTCAAGQCVARRVETPADSPRDPQHALAAELRLGNFVVWDKQRSAFTARKAGHVWLRQGKLEVEDTLEISDDLDPTAGAVVYHGQLVLHRNVLDLAVLQATGAITVHGSIEAATVQTGGDLIVHHGICGKEKGHATAHGRIVARFITNARAISGGDMVIGKEVVNSHLVCGGLLKVEHGTILAGHVIALGGITCHTAGTEAGAKTILELGLAPERYAALAKTVTTAELSLQKARDIRGAVQPLMARAKSLTAAQKEKATELLFAADEAEAQATADLAALDQTKTALHTCLTTRISVSGMLCAGVIIRFPTAAALVTATLRGPLEIVLCTKGGEHHVAVFDPYRNTTTPLHSHPHTDGTPDMVRKILSGPVPVH